MRRLVAQLFFVRVARKLAQVLTVGVRVLFKQFGQRGVAVGDQPLAPVFGAVEHRGVEARGLAAGVQRVADRFECLVVFPAHLLRQKLQLAFVRAMRRDTPGIVDMRYQTVGHRQPRDLLRRQRRQLAGQFEHFQSLAPLLTAARGQKFTGFKIFASHGDRIMH